MVNMLFENPLPREYLSKKLKNLILKWLSRRKFWCSDAGDFVLFRVVLSFVAALPNRVTLGDRSVRCLTLQADILRHLAAGMATGGILSNIAQPRRLVAFNESNQ